MTNADEPVHWSTPRKIALRFFLVFFLFYIFFNPVAVIPFTNQIYDFYIVPFRNLVIWIGAHVLHLPDPVTVLTTGSGDTTYDYVVMLFVSVTTVLATIIWSLIDRKSRNYNKLFYWLTVIVRYYVAITMISYGSYKVIKLQFPGPTPDRLIQPLGTMSPMGLAWTYMGYSTGFNYFTGLAECICGLLLFFRRTATLGAILGVVVAGNIMAINYGFDVPVKLFSTMLTVMCLFVLSKDLVRLTNFFILNKTAQAANLSPHTFKKRWQNITTTTLKYVLIVYTLLLTFYQALQNRHEYGDAAPKPPLYGLYDVISFVKNKDTIPPLATDGTRWRKFTISRPKAARVKMMNDTVNRYAIEVDTVKHRLVFDTYDDNTRADFTYTIRKDTLLLNGLFHLDSLHITMKKMDLNKFLLLQRGFHWVNEMPFNK